MKLDTLRIKIDRLDKTLLQVLKKRMDLAVQIGQIKRQRYLRTENTKRENKIKKNVQNISKELLLNSSFTAKIFKEILRESRRLQKGKL